jgi:hypothetical protein
MPSPTCRSEARESAAIAIETMSWVPKREERREADESMAVLRWSARAADGNCARNGIDAAEVRAMSMRSSASTSHRARKAVVETVARPKLLNPSTFRSATLRGSAPIAGQLPA